MGKNYTIYVSHPAFAVEKNKSGLVNKLLINHYDDKRVLDVKIHEPDAYLLSPKVAKKHPELVKHVEEQLGAAIASAEKERLCKNGHLLQEGRDRCSAKGCKYA